MSKIMKKVITYFIIAFVITGGLGYIIHLVKPSFYPIEYVITFAIISGLISLQSSLKQNYGIIKVGDLIN